MNLVLSLYVSICSGPTVKLVVKVFGIGPGDWIQQGLFVGRLFGGCLSVKVQFVLNFRVATKIYGFYSRTKFMLEHFRYL